MNAPKVGVSVLLFKGNKILLGKRLNSHGKGTWGAPGGHLEFGESVQQCACRELEEETGLVVTDHNLVNIGYYTNDIFTDENKHYVTLFVSITYWGMEPELREPDKCEGWEWFDVNNLPGPLFKPLQNLFERS